MTGRRFIDFCRWLTLLMAGVSLNSLAQIPNKSPLPGLLECVQSMGSANTTGVTDSEAFGFGVDWYNMPETQKSALVKYGPLGTHKNSTSPVAIVRATRDGRNGIYIVTKNETYFFEVLPTRNYLNSFAVFIPGYGYLSLSEENKAYSRMHPPPPERRKRRPIWGPLYESCDALFLPGLQ